MRLHTTIHVSAGMRLPTVSLANTDKPPVLVEVLLGTDVTYKGKIVMSTDPIGNLQPVVLGPSLDLPEIPMNRFYEIKCLLISAGFGDCLFKTL